MDADRDDGADGDVPHEHAPEREGDPTGAEDFIFCFVPAAKFFHLCVINSYWL